MPRFAVERYQDGDRVRAEDGSIGYVRKCHNRKTHELFLKVLITEGPSKGQWLPCWKTQPVLDWSTDGREERCAECERPYRRPKVDLGGIRQVFCRSCARVLEQRTERQERDADSRIDARTKWQIDHEGLRDMGENPDEP